MPLSTQNIESELSYAYLHAVSSKAGINCKVGNRHDDNLGIDAEISYKGDMGHPYLTQVQINVQLKATIQTPSEIDEFFSYQIQGISRYNELREQNSEIYKILVVLFLPEDSSSWLSCSSEELVLKKGAYWVALYGAPPSPNQTSQTIYLPKSNLLTPDNLLNLMHLAVHKQVPSYKLPRQ